MTIGAFTWLVYGRKYMLTEIIVFLIIKVCRFNFPSIFCQFLFVNEEFCDLTMQQKDVCLSIKICIFSFINWWLFGFRANKYLNMQGMSSFVLAFSLFCYQRLHFYRSYVIVLVFHEFEQKWKIYNARYVIFFKAVCVSLCNLMLLSLGDCLFLRTCLFPIITDAIVLIFEGKIKISECAIYFFRFVCSIFLCATIC